MPTYDYLCKNGHEFELFQSIKSEPAAECPICHEIAKRMIGAGSGLMFKGSGFYITDYKKNGNGSDGKMQTGGETKAETKQDTGKKTSAKQNG